MPNSLWSHGLQHARLLCPPLSPGVCSNSYPLSWWCYPTISSSVVPFSSFSQSFPASGPFPMSRLFTSVGQIIGASSSASVLPMNIQDWFLLRWLVWSWCLRDSQESSTVPWFESINSSSVSLLYGPLSHPYMTTGETRALSIWAFVGKLMSLLFNMLSRFCHSFPCKEQASFNFMATVTLHSDFGAQENKICHAIILVF